MSLAPVAERAKWDDMYEDEVEDAVQHSKDKHEPPAPPKHRWEDDALSPEVCGWVCV